MKKFWVCAGATLAFWALIFLGPAIIMLFNNIGYYFSGGGYGPESFMYKVLQFFSQPISCAIAASAAESITGGNHKACTIANCVICALMCFLFAMITSDKAQLATMILSAVVSAIMAVLRATQKAEKATN